MIGILGARTGGTTGGGEWGGSLAPPEKNRLKRRVSVNSERYFGKSGGQFALASPVQILWESFPVPHVICARI